MSLVCAICGNYLYEGPDNIVFCANKKGGVHLGCCCDRCSQDHEPCEHCLGIYKKVD